MSRLILVRHALPEVVQGVASTLWGLSESAREDCVVLAHNLDLPLSGPPIYSSAERKAKETADVLALRLGRDTAMDAGFGETDRPDVWNEDYRALVVRYLGGESIPGWEPRASVVSRFTAACDRAIAAANGADVVVVNHGQALSLYLDSVVSIDLVPFWRALTLPDAWALDLETKTLTHVHVAGLPPPDA